MAERDEDAGENSKTILIVEDDAASHRLLKGYVAAMGHTSLSADNGSAALALMEKQTPDLVLLDMIMPEMNGYDVLKHMKADERLRSLPVIMITAIDELDVVVRCIERGADDYLIKPFNPALLKARMGACLEKKQLRDQERHLYEKLMASERARDALTHMIVHDLSNPLISIMGFVNILLREVRKETIKNSKLVEYLEIIENSGTHMSSLIQNILDVSRLEDGKMPVSLSPVDAVEISREVLAQTQGQAETLGVKLAFQCELGKAPVSADKALLSRILENLLSNAVEHTGNGTNVALSVTENGEDVLFRIADDGPGIPDEWRDRVFEKFFQAEARKRGKKYGTGLGLTFSKMAVEAQGGRIWIDSREGKGTCFNVALKVPND